MWNAAWTDIYAGVKQRYDQPKPLSGYSVWDGLGWLTSEAMELTGPAPLCIENPKGQAQVGWTLDRSVSCPYSGHCCEVQNGARAAVPTGTLWAGGPHEWPYLYGNRTGHYT